MSLNMLYRETNLTCYVISILASEQSIYSILAMSSMVVFSGEPLTDVKIGYDLCYALDQVGCYYWMP